MKIKNAIRIAVMTAITLGAAAGSAQARGPESGLSREAHRVVDAADRLRREVDKHFRHSASYRHLVNDAAAIRRKAEHVDRLSHRVHGLGDVRHLQEDLAELDALAHHTGRLVAGISRGHGRARGHTHGDTRHVEALVASINRSLHAMERMVDGMERGFAHRVGRGHGRGYGGHSEVRYARPPVSVGVRVRGPIFQGVLRRR